MSLQLEILERRDMPATFGIPWGSSTTVTLSFAPDGTDVDGTPSELHSMMSENGLSEKAWKTQIFKAVQAWTASADLNLGVMRDDGSALGATGFQQSDERFGDIRVFAVPMSSGVLAVTTPPGDLGGTRTGDIILNSNYNFGVGVGAERDIYTVFLQEAGHAFGIGNSPNSASAMYEYYQGTRAGLHATDVAAVRDLYAIRSARAWEATAGNDTRAAATPLGGSGTLVSYGDLASSADTDWYSFVASQTGRTKVELQTAGLSLLSGRLAIFNASGIFIKQISSTEPGTDLSLQLSLTANNKYFVRVDEQANTPFAAGQYRLRIESNPEATETVTLAGQSPADDSNANESFLSATRLNNIAKNGDTVYSAFAHLRQNDIDVYRVRTPSPGLNQANVLTATVRAFGAIAPEINVTNFLGLPVQATVIADGNGIYVVQVAEAAARMDYHIIVHSRSNSIGDYELGVGFRSAVTTPHTVASGLLSILNPKATGSIEVTGSAQIYFRLSALLTPVIGPSIVLRVFDSANNLKFQLLAQAGDRVDGVALLGAGRYRVEIQGNGGFLPFVLSGFTLETALLTDPIGVKPSDPNEPGDSGKPPPPPPSNDDPPPPPSSYTYYDANGNYVWRESTTV